MSDETEDPFRWCVHCGADCWPDEDDQEHADDCPSVTGLWPIEAGHWGGGCPNCGCERCRAARPVCMGCGEPFSVGDMSMRRDADTGEIAVRPYIGEVICVGCAAKVATT